MNEAINFIMRAGILLLFVIAIFFVLIQRIKKKNKETFEDRDH